MAEVIENEIETNEALSADRPSWWNKWKVPAAPLILGMTILTGAVAYGYALIEWNREDNAAALTYQACLAQREFRGFFTSYLESQVGTEITEIPGFDQLSPEARELALQLAPVVEAGREQDQAYLAEFVVTFPIPVCVEP